MQKEVGILGTNFFVNASPRCCFLLPAHWFGDEMKNIPLRKQAEELIENIERENNRLERLAYEIYESENGESFSGGPVRTYGYKAILRALGYMI